MIAALLLPLAACKTAPAAEAATSEPTLQQPSPGPMETPGSAEEFQPATDPEPGAADGGNILIAFFSRADENYGVGYIEKGNTHILAEMIAEETGGTLFHMERDTPYPAGYDACTDEVMAEKEANARPALKEDIDIGGYDVIFLGYPIWWGDMPMPVYTFLEGHDFTGKTVIPFCTHGGSGLSGTVSSIARATGATVLDGLAIPGTTAQNEQDQAKTKVMDWLLALGYVNTQGGATNMSSNSITTNGGAKLALSSLAHRTAEEGAPIVYYTAGITPEALMKVYEALSWSPTGKVAVKLSTGEPPASNYLAPDLIKNLVQSVNGTIVECNTAYGGSRASTAAHYQVAEDHGFTAIADFQILDENGSMSIPVTGGTRLTENFVGAAFADYGSYLILSHFKGHAMAGFGGAIKNISIGLGSAEGKSWIHSGGTSKTDPWGGAQDAFCEAMAEAGKAVSDYLGNGERIAYINVMNRLSIDCDCDGHPSEPDIHDIGILASTDPVALDQACVDLIFVSEGNESLVNRTEDRDGLHTLEHAEAIGLGSRSYRLADIG